MKAVLILMISSSLMLGNPLFNSTEENRRIEAEQVSLWVGKISLLKSKSSMETVGALALGLRNMGYRKEFEGHSSSVDTIYGDLQNKILSIPNHAQYFADEIKREQKAVEPYPTNTGPRVSYDFSRTRSFETLGHLPSPATIAVLGNFLSDDIDTPSELNSPGSDWGPNPKANSYFSSTTIMKIGLRNPPVPTQRRNDDPVVRLAETRAWWEEIKSGKRTFSFLGQKMEYRFKPDGTWETIALANAPDDAPTEAKSSPLAPPESTRTSPTQRAPWGWIVGVMMLLLAGVAWLARRRSQHGAR